MWRETIKLRLAWSLLFILWGKFSAMVNHYAVEHDLQKYSRALCASVPLLCWKIMGLYPIKNCIKSLKYYMYFAGISLIRLFCMCRCWEHTEKGSSDWLLPFKSSSGVQDFCGYWRCKCLWSFCPHATPIKIFNLGEMYDEGKSLWTKNTRQSHIHGNENPFHAFWKSKMNLHSDSVGHLLNKTLWVVF